jgi:filamentous hemagglutinin family protein
MAGTNIEATTTAPLNLGTHVDRVGSTTQITDGTRPGGGTNLFHSFDAFTVGTGDVAHFMNNMQLQTTNIIARVIGGERSTIDGVLRTNNPLDAADPMNFGAANLWLVNPSGLLLGPNAHVEVGGSVSMSTANYLRFDGQAALFDMLSSPASLGALDVAPVVAFGFTGLELPDPIIVQGSMLQVQEGKSLSLVGGDITLQAGTLEDGTVQAASLLASGGRINLVSVASPGEVLVPSFQTGPNINGAFFSTMGTVMLKEGSTLDVSGQLGADAEGNPIGGNSGTVFVRGGQLVMDASSILASSVGTVAGANNAVDLNVGTLRLLGGSTISSSTVGTDLDFDGVADIIGGPGGNITVQGLQGMGSAADSVLLAGGSKIASDAQIFSEGGGRISITATSLGLDEVSSIESSTSATKLDLNGDGIVDITGRGGDIVVAIQRLSILGSASIASSATNSTEGAAADGGTVTVRGLDGSGSKAGSVLLSGETTGIVSNSFFGVPGDITVNAGTLTVTNGAAIAAGSALSDGPAGNVTVTADSVVISADGQIFSRSFAQNSGQVTITADALTMDNGSIVTSTSSESGGRGGDVVLNGGTVRLTNGASINSQSGSEEDQGRFSTGRAGDIIMSVTSLTLANRSKITSSSLGTEPNAGDAGNITIQSESTVVLNDSLITTEARAASGGKIEINAPEMIRLTNSEVSTSVKGVAGESNGGDISIDPQFVILQNSQMIAQANAGAGGAIDIIATSAFIRDPASIVDASSTLGISGTINIQSPLQNIGGELAPLSDEFSSAAALLAQQCAARAAGGKFSTFVVAAREGLPLEPGGFLASPSLTAESLGSRLSGRNLHAQFSAVTGAFQEHNARPIQLAKLGGACR